MGDLKQTKGTFKIRGQVVGLDHENAFREGTTRITGKPYFSMRFGVKTSPTNTIYVELFGMEKEKCYASYFVEEKDKKVRKSKDFPFSQRNNLPKGYHLIGVNCLLEKDVNKLVKKTYVEKDAVLYIRKFLRNDDWVYIGGNLQFGENEKDGKTYDQKQFSINYISRISEIDFEDEEFEEVSNFSYEIVVVDLIEDNETENLLVTGRTINYEGKFVDNQFTIYKNEENKKYMKFFNRMSKLKFGDFLKVFGDVLNKIEIVDNESEDDDDIWGDKPSAYKPTMKGFKKDFVIKSADGSTLTEKMYTVNDFMVEEGISTEESDPFESKDPFGDDEDDIFS